MSAALLEPPTTFSDSRQGARRVGGRPVTLEQRLQAAWRAAQHEGVAECPVCGAAMRAEGHGARCRGCESVVS